MRLVDLHCVWGYKGPLDDWLFTDLHKKKLNLMRKFVAEYDKYETNKTDFEYIENLDKNLQQLHFPVSVKNYLVYQYEIVGQMLRDFILFFYARDLKTGLWFV